MTLQVTVDNRIIKYISRKTNSLDLISRLCYILRSTEKVTNGLHYLQLIVNKTTTNIDCHALPSSTMHITKVYAILSSSPTKPKGEAK